MKKVLLTILSLLLVAASIFGIFAGVASLKDVLNIYDYKMADADSGRAAINDQLLPGIQQLSDNYDTYMDGVKQFEDGKAAYADGQAQLAAGAAKLAAGEQQLAAGKAELAANTDRYNEGKAQIAMLEGYMPLIEGIANAAQNLRNFNAGIPVVGQTIDSLGGQLRSAVMNLLANSGAVAAISNMVGMDIGGILASNPTDTSICGNVVAMYYDGLAQLKMYEDGQAQVAAGEQQLAQGYADYAAGQQQLADGAKQLADGEAQLAVFEEGQVTLLVGLTRLLTQPAYQVGVGQVYPSNELPEPLFANIVNNIEESDREAVNAAIRPGFWDTDDQTKWSFPSVEGSGKEVCPSMLTILRQDDYLGPNFNPATDVFMWENENIMVRNGYPVVNLANAKAIAEAGLDYIDKYQAAAVTHEVLGRAIPTVLLLLGSLFGCIAGLLGLISLFSNKFGGAKVFGCLSALSAIAGVIVALVMGAFRGSAFGVTDGTENPWGHIISRLPDGKYIPALVILAVVALLFWLVAGALKRAAKREKAAAKRAAAAAAAPAAQPVYAAPVAQPVYAAPAQPVAQPVYAAPAQPVAQPVVEPAAVKAAYADALAAAEAAKKAAAAAEAAAAAGDVAAAQKAAAAAAAAAEAAKAASEVVD